MRQSEPVRIDPAPAQQIARDDENEAGDDKRDDGDMQCEHHVGGELIAQSVVHLDGRLGQCTGEGALQGRRSFSIEPAKRSELSSFEAGSGRRQISAGAVPAQRAHWPRAPARRIRIPALRYGATDALAVADDTTSMEIS